MPKTGGIIQLLIPSFADLSVTGSLARGAAGVAKAVSDAKSANIQLLESQRHNKTILDIAPKGKCLYLRQYRQG